MPSTKILSLDFSHEMSQVRCYLGAAEIGCGLYLEPADMMSPREMLK
jgi:hypothetical protein